MLRSIRTSFSRSHMGIHHLSFYNNGINPYDHEKRGDLIYETEENNTL